MKSVKGYVHRRASQVGKDCHKVFHVPIYEYRCESCGAELEKLQKISDPPLLECPECGKDSLKKLVSASSFRLKGSGWYETDFKTGKKKNGVGEGAAEGAGNADSSTAETAADSSSSTVKDADTGAENKSSPEKLASGKEAKKEAVKSDDSGTGATKKPAPKA